jgi:hypothetical protein
MARKTCEFKVIQAGSRFSCGGRNGVSVSCHAAHWQAIEFSFYFSGCDVSHFSI